MDGTQFGPYRLTELLGRGGMGEVWRAHDTTIDRVVALKVLPANYGDTELFKQRFRRDVRAAAELDEPHVVPIHDFGEIDGRLFVTMPLIQGRDLRVLLDDGPLPPARTVGIVEQIASALSAAHEIGLVHRDVKPSNILVTDDDFAYLTDFGIARAAGEIGLTSAGATIGTWAYMAPERFQRGVADARTDIYALACALYQSLTGQLPFPGDSLEQIAVAHMLQPPPQPSALREGIPAEMDQVIATGMAKDPEQRYATTKDLAQAARTALATPIQHPSPPSASPSTSPARPPTQSATAVRSEVSPGGPADTLSQESDAQRPSEGVLAEKNPPSQAQLPTMAAPASTEDRQIASAPPTRETFTPEKAPFVQRLSRHPKVTFAVVTIAAVAAVAATIIVTGRTSSGGGNAAQSSTTELSPTTTATPPPPSMTSAPDPVARLHALAPRGPYRCDPPSPSVAPWRDEQARLGTLAVLLCFAPIPNRGPWVPGIVTLYLFGDQGSMDNAFKQFLNKYASKGGVPEPCPGLSAVPQAWHRPATPQQTEGEIGCLWSPGEMSTPYLYWTSNSELVLGEVEDVSNLHKLYEWWLTTYGQ
jgi:serine/threonine protein kinase